MEDTTKVGAWSDDRMKDQMYFPSNGIALPECVLINKNGDKVMPIDFREFFDGSFSKKEINQGENPARSVATDDE